MCHFNRNAATDDSRQIRMYESIAKMGHRRETLPGTQTRLILGTGWRRDCGGRLREKGNHVTAETCPSLGGMDEDTFVSFFCGRESQRLECVLKGSECGVSHCCATFRRSTPWRFVGGKDESAAERPLQASAISVLAVVGLKRTVQRFGISILQNSNGSFSLSGQSLCFFPRFKLKHTEINPRPARVLDTFVFAVLHPRCCTR
ncbi:hypothetical protein CI102_2538 [Trichoderma harzianum]|nr:hypothetical protein CI102_2538 [Trichoderma harzianum]